MEKVREKVDTLINPQTLLHQQIDDLESRLEAQRIAWKERRSVKKSERGQVLEQLEGMKQEVEALKLKETPLVLSSELIQFDL